MDGSDKAEAMTAEALSRDSAWLKETEATISRLTAENAAMRKALDTLASAVEHDAWLSPHHPYKNRAIAALEIATRSARAALATPSDHCSSTKSEE